MTIRILTALLSVVLAMEASAHQITFNSSMTYTNVQPTGDSSSVANWTGAAFDGDNIGGNGTNRSNTDGTANDDYTYVANDRPVQGQSFLTGSNVNGYQLNAVTVRMAGYSNNNSGENTFWDLNEQNGPIILTICEIDGTIRTVQTTQNFKAGEVGNPGSGNSADGPGTYITFHLPFTTYLKPNTTYGFELQIGNGGANYFEWLGIRTDPYADGTAYQYSGSTITPLTGDHVFMADMSALSSSPSGFVHPGALHTQADIDRMKAKVAAGEEPWLSGYNKLLSSPYNNLGWPAYDVDYINRGTTSDNYTRCQQDAQLIYTLTLIWQLTGDTAYADRAVEIANVWSGLVGIQGDSNRSLAAGICGFLFASSGELLSTYSGWAEADQQTYKDMMMRVFYPENFDFLWRHHDTFFSEGGNTHYRLNWDTANMASMAAIGILCDNRAVYEQAVDYFKHGPGNGNVRRAAWYIHPGGLGQGEEAGRDQGHNLGGWYFMAQLCQMAWNQGDDLFSYDNNRVLRAFEYNAKYNLGNDVPYARHRDSMLSYTEGSVSSAGRGLGGYYQYELVYNHYQNIMGIAAPWSKLAADATRTEPWPDTAIHPSQVDWFGLGTLTYSKDATTNDVAPSGLRANWSKNRIVLDWWGSATATNYIVKRATAEGGPYTPIGSVAGPDLNFTDTSVTNNTVYFYKMVSQTPSGDLESDSLRVAQELVTLYSFEGSTTNEVAGGGEATPHGGSTGLPGYATGFGDGQAVDLDGVDDYVQLPVDTANFQDITVAAWVNWDGGGNWQRIFDFGSEIEKSMYLTPSNGGGLIQWGFTTTRGGNFVGDASYYLTGPAMPVGTWTHVAVTLNGDAMTLYVNGVPVDTRVNDLIDPLYSQPFCYIGKSMYNADPLFNGRIDDFRIYNHALSGAEVYNLWGQSANHPPVFDTDPFEQSTTEDAAFSASISATDADGGTLTYSKVTGPDWLSVASNGSLSGTPSNDNVGENYAVVRVTDSSGATDDATLWISVANSNDVPTWTVDPIDGGTNLQGIAYAFSVAGDVNDVDAGDALTISKVGGPAWLNVATNGTLSGTPGTGDVGINNVTLRVSDTVGAYADAIFTVMVLPGTTLAYWNFEEGTTNTSVTGPATDGTYSGTILDVSGNGFHASPFWAPDNANIQWTANVPAATTPQTGTTNAISLGNTGTSYFSVSTTGNGQTPDPNAALHTWTPTAWTIEAAFSLGRLNAADGSGNITIVGRDGNTSGAAPLYFGTRNFGTMAAVEFRDVDGNDWNLTANHPFTIDNWYALAATSDGGRLKLYFKDITGGDAGYTLLNTLDISGSSNPAMSTGTGDGGDWDAGNFSIGRGLYNGGHVDRIADGTCIDDVRISNAALNPSQFLYSASSPAIVPEEYTIGSYAIIGGTNLSLTVSNSVPGHNYGMLATDSLTPPVWSNILVAAGNSSNLQFSLPIDPASSNRFFKLDVQRQ